MTDAYTAIALIPARAGSKRVPHKNVARLGPHPALACAIASAKASGAFDAVMVCTDDPLYRDVAEHYGAEVPFLRPTEISSGTSPDIDWVTFVLSNLREMGRTYDLFSILRPTNPFRRPSTIADAVARLKAAPGADSLRAVSPVTEHPGKMWVIRGGVMHPLMPLTPVDRPWHSQQMSVLPPVYKQNASLEVAWTRVAMADPPTIAGEIILPLISEGYEGFDINQPGDLEEARNLLAAGVVALPRIDAEPYPHRLPGEQQ